MSRLDIVEAKRALAARLRDWGVTEDDYTKASGFIDDLIFRGWVMDPNRESRPQPPRKNEHCHTCQKHIDKCICGQRLATPMAAGDVEGGLKACRDAMRSSDV